jgi:hypothetical protein
VVLWPDKVSACGELGPLSVKATLPEAVGANCTFKLALWPVLTVRGMVMPLIPTQRR